MVLWSLTLCVALGVAPATAAAAAGAGVASKVEDDAPDGYWTVYDTTGCDGVYEERGDCEDMDPCEECDKVHCKLGQWADWSAGDCTGLCERQRGVIRENNECGNPCVGDLVQTKNERSCHQCPAEKKQDCVWSEWSEWGDCSCKCGGGQRTRDRGIKIAPAVGGKLCDNRTRTEMGICNTKSCKGECVDAEWQDWGDWGACSASCEGGVQRRIRQPRRQANRCGEGLSGLAEDARECNPEPCHADQDCILGSWGPWSDCSCTCDGVVRRSRRIEQYGKGLGLWCNASTKQIAPCNLGVCGIENPVNCLLGDWKDWSSCSASCGGGQRNRLRNIERESSDGGNPCSGTLKETIGCAPDACLINGTEPKHCKWGDWSDWGACDKCNGQQRRFRHIVQMPEFGGRPCGKNVTAEETTKCKRKCHEKLYCTWGDWGDYGVCSVSCGNNGYRRRERRLMPTSASTIEERKFTATKPSIEDMKAQGHFARLVSAFVTGFVTLSVGMASLRLFRGAAARTHPMTEDQEPLQGALE